MDKLLSLFEEVQKRQTSAVINVSVEHEWEVWAHHEPIDILYQTPRICYARGGIKEEVIQDAIDQLIEWLS